jgi:hypothetical protein
VEAVIIERIYGTKSAEEVAVILLRLLLELYAPHLLGQYSQQDKNALPPPGQGIFRPE